MTGPTTAPVPPYAGILEVKTESKEVVWQMVLPLPGAASYVLHRQQGRCAIPECAAMVRTPWLVTAEGGRVLGAVCKGHSLARRLDQPEWQEVLAAPPEAPPGVQVYIRRGGRRRPWANGAPDVAVDLSKDPSCDPPATWGYLGTPVHVLLELQRRRCAICLKALVFGRSKQGQDITTGVHVDHEWVEDPERGEITMVRGILCQSCNTCLTKRRLPPTWWGPVWARHEAYLDSPPAWTWPLTDDLRYPCTTRLPGVFRFDRQRRDAVIKVLLRVAGDDPEAIAVACDERWFDRWYYAGTAVHALLVAQRGLCAVTGERLNPPDRLDGQPVDLAATLDHEGDKQRGRLRGLVTPSSNGIVTKARVAEGRLPEDARAYLDDPPAQRFEMTKDLCFSKAPTAWLIPNGPKFASDLAREAVRAAADEARKHAEQWIPCQTR